MTDTPGTPVDSSAAHPSAAMISTADSMRFLLVTGMSGAGKSTALKALEDMGYEAVDNLPLSLLPALIAPHESAVDLPRRPLAIGIDIRTRDFGVDKLLGVLDGVIDNAGFDTQLIFLDCEDEILRRRYTETRRRHPLAADRPVVDGIAHERRLLLKLRDRSDIVIDTTGLALNDLRQLLRGHFSLEVEDSFAVSVMSFSYRRGVPREADLVFDVRFLANPHYVPDLQPLTGLDPAVAAYVSADEDFEQFFASLKALLAPLFPRFRREGKAYLTIAIGCTGGQHRSVYVADRLTSWLTEQGEQASVAHRELQDSAAT
tara:strand:+ start:1158 stop:2108 length:951 start_codon:yes stop_codon:yes gene_type:complete